MYVPAQPIKNEAKNPAAAIEQGEQAYAEQRKKDINKNPYPPGHAWRVYWDRGWIAAKEREEKSNG